MSEPALVGLAAIGLIAIACQWLAWRVRLPAILFLLLAGLLAGPVSGWLDPDALLGTLLFPIISLSVAVILFEGSLTLRFDEIRGLERVVRNMISVGLAITWIVTALATHSLTGLNWELAFLFGALVVVTGPTVIVPMLRTVRPNARIANILRWEGIVIDPVGALLAVLVFEFVISSSLGDAWGHIAWVFGLILMTGLIIGAGAGYLLGLILRNFWMPEYLHNVATLCLVLGVFAVSNLIHEESGLLAVTVMGIWLANMRDVHTEDILDFKESLSVLLISGLFIILAARVEFVQFSTLGWAALGVLAAIQFVARPLKVLVSSLGSTLTWHERALIAWIAPRGIVAAAISAVFALRLEQAGFSQAQLLVPLTFIVIIGTVVLQSATAGPLARLLNVAEPEPTGLLIIGANPFARAVGMTLNAVGFKTVLTDTSWENVRAARMEGLPTYYGNAVSEHADRHLDLIGIGKILALSSHAELNALACVRYRSELGRNAVYRLPPTGEKTDKHKVAADHSGYTLFGDDVTYAKLASLLSQGAEIRVTALSEDFSFGDFVDRHGRRAIPLFALDSKKRLRVVVAGEKISPPPGWSVISLVQAEESPQASAQTAKEARATT